MIGFDLLGLSMARPSNGKGGEWMTVNRNRRNLVGGNKWDILKLQNEGVKGKLTLFFFIDFNKEWTAKDLFYEFKSLGVIDEIVIPAKMTGEERNTYLSDSSPSRILDCSKPSLTIYGWREESS